MEFNGIIKAGQIVLSVYQTRLRRQYLDACKDGQKIVEKITKDVSHKTYQQVKTHWGLTIGTIKKTFDDRGWDINTIVPKELELPDGYPISRDMIQDILYAACNDVGEEGERKTLSKMNTIEASKFFEKCRDYVAIKWHIQIADPDIHWKDKK